VEFEFGVWGLGFGVWGVWVEVQVKDLEFGVLGSGFKAKGFELRI
jgi:hypothetical protein